jgi:SAM-dependent methyltransferase
MTGSYVIRGGVEGKRRLDLLAHILAGTTDDLLRRAGVGAGMRCLDLGCGGGHVSRSLARLVGDTGRVIGLDIDPIKVDAADEDARAAGLANVEFRTADVTVWAEEAAYDVVYGRFILSHLGGREALIGRMRDALREGGVLILEDIDFQGSFSHPESAAFLEYCALYREVVRRRGGDAHLGSRLYTLCLDANLADVRLGVVQPVHAGCGTEKRLSLSTLVNIGDAVLAESLATKDQLDDTIAALATFTDDPRSMIALPRIFQVWGRRAASP